MRLFIIKAINHKNELFCERNFGSIKNEFCASRKYLEIGVEKRNPKIYQQCKVEFDNSRIQRYQMGVHQTRI
jgi:hypothetical protein